MKIAVLSDTHGILRAEVAEQIKNSDAVIHGGDIDTRDIFNKIKKTMKPGISMFAVRGNNDGEWAAELPDSLAFELCGIKFFLVHNKKDIPRDIGADIIIFGHSHKYYEENIGGRLWLNPGSSGRRRFNLPLTMAMLNVDESGYSVKKIEIESRRKNTLVPDKDLLKIIQSVIRRTDKGESVAVIADKLKLDTIFVEQIMRLRVTHPGVDVDEIMNKIVDKK